MFIKKAKKEINKLKCCLNNEIIDDFFVCIFSPPNVSKRISFKIIKKSKPYWRYKWLKGRSAQVCFSFFVEISLIIAKLEAEILSDFITALKSQ